MSNEKMATTLNIQIPTESAHAPGDKLLESLQITENVSFHNEALFNAIRRILEPYREIEHTAFDTRRLKTDIETIATLCDVGRALVSLAFTNCEPLAEVIDELKARAEASQNIPETQSQITAP